MAQEKFNIKSMDLYLAKVGDEFVSIKKHDLQKSIKVFNGVIKEIKRVMGTKCEYFRDNSSEILLGGSVNDHIKIIKMDEFDVDVVIQLSDKDKQHIVVEHDQPGFVRLKTTEDFDNAVPNKWLDEEKYLLQDKFWRWMRGIVESSLSKMGQVVENIDGENYVVTFKQSGPACTLHIERKGGGFHLDVDLVPVLKFLYRQKSLGYGYREINWNIPESAAWLAVPKPNRALDDSKARDRTWRLSFQDVEKHILKGKLHLKPTIRLLKKLRDTLKINKIASYYIKTLFLWQIVEKEKEEKNQQQQKGKCVTPYWGNNLSTLFGDMVYKFYNAMNKEKISYFWQEEHNLIGHIDGGELKKYADALQNIYGYMISYNVAGIVSALLTVEELQKFAKSTFWEKHPFTLNTPTMLVAKDHQEPSCSKSVTVSIPNQNMYTDNVNLLTIQLLKKIHSGMGDTVSQQIELAKIIKSIAENSKLLINERSNQPEIESIREEGKTQSHEYQNIINDIILYNTIQKADEHSVFVDDEKIIPKDELLKSLIEKFRKFVNDNETEADELLRDVKGAVVEILNGCMLTAETQTCNDEIELSDSSDCESIQSEEKASKLGKWFNWKKILSVSLPIMMLSGPRDQPNRQDFHAPTTEVVQVRQQNLPIDNDQFRYSFREPMSFSSQYTGNQDWQPVIRPYPDIERAMQPETKSTVDSVLEDTQHIDTRN